MDENGLSEVINPSEIFIAERSMDIAGTSIYPSLEGTRPILLESTSLGIKRKLWNHREM